MSDGDMMMDDLHREEIEQALRRMRADAPNGDDAQYARKALGFTHAELSAALGFPEADARRWEVEGPSPLVCYAVQVLLLRALPTASPPPDRDAPIRVVTTADAEQALAFLLTADPADLLGRSRQPSDGPDPIVEALRDVFRHRDHLAAQVTALQARGTAAVEAKRLMVAALAGVVVGFDGEGPDENPYAHPGDAVLRAGWAHGHEIGAGFARRVRGALSVGAT